MVGFADVPGKSVAPARRRAQAAVGESSQAQTFRQRLMTDLLESSSTPPDAPEVDADKLFFDRLSASFRQLDQAKAPRPHARDAEASSSSPGLPLLEELTGK